MPSLRNQLNGPLVLMILDGFGEREPAQDNAISEANMPYYKALLERFSHTTIGTSGADVGLPPGQMGNSEVGHLNFGAGRIAQMDISRIDCAVAERTLANNPEIARAMQLAKENQGRLHLMGLVSTGGVHSSLEHLLALIESAKANGLSVVVHAFLDGRDTPPKSAELFVKQVLDALDSFEPSKGLIGTIMGRFYAMDRDKRWDRVEKAFHAIVFAEGTRTDSPLVAIRDAYASGETDEVMFPRVLSSYDGVHENDVALFFNFRPDRARELSTALTQSEFSSFVRQRTSGQDVQASWKPPFVTFVCMTEYDSSLALPVAFRKVQFEHVFPELIANAGLRQLRCAETEKYAHVTYFFNGGRERPFDGEERILIPSPRGVASYDLAPEMSAKEVADAVVKAIRESDFDFILVNFANPDMVGHTGVLQAAIKAVETVDQMMQRICEAALEKNGTILVTADHGNCEQMVNAETGEPFTQHTTNRVPLIYVRAGHERTALRKDGRIADVAPTMLALLGIEQPISMTGQSLLG